MSNREFEKLVENRKNWVFSSKENKFDFDSILAGLYNDPSHFIYEILQNAEDAKAPEVEFKLFEDRLDVFHNGTDFDLEDIDGVTGIGISKKKDDLNLIGKFGVGFKSVFAITESPYIFSGEYKIKIEDFVIPSIVNGSEQVKGTLIRLPFNHKLRSKEEVFSLVAKKLENLGLKTLLFLRNIKEIKWQWRTPSSSGHYLKSSESLEEIPNAKRIAIISSSVAEEYIVIEKPIRIENKELKVEVAYKLGKEKNGKETIIQEPDSKLVVFFPTEKVTFLNFLIQGPYKTTPNRENIPVEDEQNKMIIEETGNLVAESLSAVKGLGCLDVNFLNVLPINPEHKEKDKTYSIVYDKVKEKFISEELLPTSDGKYAKAGDVLLARGKELTEFLSTNDLQELFSKQNWLDTNITYDRTRELRDYLTNELEVKEVDFEDFARGITVAFLQKKTDDWIINFYARLLDQQTLWSDREYSKGILRIKPIIRLETNEHIAPFDENGRVQVYLPAEGKSKYKTVKRSLTENENSLKFLKELGLREPDIFAEIKEFVLPKYLIDTPVKDEEYFEDFEKLLRAYESIPAKKKEEFIEELSQASFIDAVHNGTEEHCLRKPSETYFNDKDLKSYFDGYPYVYFVSDELYKKFGEERLKLFLKDLGVEDKPRRIEISGNLSWEEKSKLRGNSGCTDDIYQRDYEYEGLENFINHMTIDKSCLFWKLLIKNIESLSSWTAQIFFEGEYSWLYYSQRRKRFDAKFIKMLRQQEWLVDKNNNFRKPSDITFPELSDNYNKESQNIDILIKVLEFKSEIIAQLPEDSRKKLEIVKDLSLEELERLVSTKKEPLEKEKTWTPEYNPDIVVSKITNVEPDKIPPPILEGQTGEAEIKDDKETSDKGEEKIEEDVSERPSRVDKKKIGRWGEEHVYHTLKKERQKLGIINETDSGFNVMDVTNEKFEIVWLNKHRDKGKGCDFVIKKNGEEIEYIEVKTKTGKDEELIDVTGTQWEFARKLFEQNEGERYSFYVVSNAGKGNAQIKVLKNPIKLWKEGRLYAHPVNFKL